jgi:hypothetical protein
LAVVGGGTLAVAALAALLALGVSRRIVLGDIGDAQARDAAGALWGSLFGDLRSALMLLAVCGAVTVAAARSLLRAVSVEPVLRRAWALATTTPERTALRVVRALLLLGAGIVALTDPQVVLDLLLLAGGLLLVMAGVNELIRVTGGAREPAPAASASAPRQEGGRRGRRRRIVLAGVVVLALLGLSAVLTVREGGVSAAVTAITGCNGHRALCDRRLDELTLASTHNAMSAATNPGWLFAQQDRGIDDQLKDGVRALMIDTYYGRPAGGSVKTEISSSPDELSKIEQELGPEAFAAAKRIRDRVEGEAEGPRGIYLCHALCELGALPISTALGQVRAFLELNRGDVVMLIVEDSVTPEDFVDAVRRAGLERYAYDGPTTPPWPTLRELIRDDRRLLVFAERRSGGAPWLHLAFEAMQETPFRFRQSALLTDPARLEASCRPNRGEPGASLFLINHWIDTSPAPRPSNADRVNAREPLLRRARTCEAQRGLTANVLAVDFYRRGDLFEVVDELNGVGG